MARLRTPLEALQQFIAPPRKPTERGPLTRRKAVERALGLSLPPDLYEFGRVYGSGEFRTSEFSGLVEIWNPLSAAFVQRVTEWADTVREIKAAEGEEYIPFDIYPLRPGLLMFGSGDNRQLLFWLTDGEPHHWPVLLWPPERRFLRFDMPVTEFLFRLLSGKIEGWGGTHDAEWFKSKREEMKFRPAPAVR